GVLVSDVLHCGVRPPSELAREIGRDAPRRGRARRHKEKIAEIERRPQAAVRCQLVPRVRGHGDHGWNCTRHSEGRSPRPYNDRRAVAGNETRSGERASVAPASAPKALRRVRRSLGGGGSEPAPFDFAQGVVSAAEARSGERESVYKGS